LNDVLTSNGRLQRLWRWLAIAWLLVLIGLGVQQWQLWKSESRIDTDILALLPQDAHDRLLSDVTRRIADANARQIVVLLGSTDAAQTKAAEAAFRDAIKVERGAAPLLQESGSIEGWFDQARAFYAPYRDRLLTSAQRERLQNEPTDGLAESALAALYGPMGAPRLTEWRQDPLSLWPQWWQERALGSGLQMGDDAIDTVALADLGNAAHGGLPL